ncbi:unnamed protein product, partial [Brenthis ino]
MVNLCFYVEQIDKLQIVHSEKDTSRFQWRIVHRCRIAKSVNSQYNERCCTTLTLRCGRDEVYNIVLGNMQVSGLNRAIIATSLLGVLVSTYALYVGLAVEAKPGYKAFCDLSEYASCSKVLTSKYAKGLGLAASDSMFKIPNSANGIIFYCIIIFLTTFDKITAVKIQIGLSVASLAICVYLAYLLMFVLIDFCLFTHSKEKEVGYFYSCYPKLYRLRIGLSFERSVALGFFKYLHGCK